MSAHDTVWQRVDSVAFVDDGERVVALRLDALPSASPQLLAGPAAEAWRALETPTTTMELQARLTAESYPDAPMVQSLLEQLESAGLCCRVTC